MTIQEEKCELCNEVSTIEKIKRYSFLPGYVKVDIKWTKKRKIWDDDIKFQIDDKIDLNEYLVCQDEKIYINYYYELSSLLLVKKNNNKKEYIVIYKKKGSDEFILYEYKREKRYTISEINDIGYPIILFYEVLESKEDNE